MDARERNAAMCRFLREATQRGINGPFCRNLYATARLKGKSPEKAQEAAKQKKS